MLYPELKGMMKSSPYTRQKKVKAGGEERPDQCFNRALHSQNYSEFSAFNEKCLWGIICSVTISVLSRFLYITAPCVEVLQLSNPAGCGHASFCFIPVVPIISTEFGSRQHWEVYSGRSTGTHKKNLSA